jgi:hypothetical protein
MVLFCQIATKGCVKGKFLMERPPPELSRIGVSETVPDR